MRRGQWSRAFVTHFRHAKPKQEKKEGHYLSLEKANSALYVQRYANISCIYACHSSPSSLFGTLALLQLKGREGPGRSSHLLGTRIEMMRVPGRKRSWLHLSHPRGYHILVLNPRGELHRTRRLTTGGVYLGRVVVPLPELWYGNLRLNTL